MFNRKPFEQLEKMGKQNKVFPHLWPVFIASPRNDPFSSASQDQLPHGGANAPGRSLPVAPQGRCWRGVALGSYGIFWDLMGSFGILWDLDCWLGLGSWLICLLVRCGFGWQNVNLLRTHQRPFLHFCYERSQTLLDLSFGVLCLFTKDLLQLLACRCCAAELWKVGKVYLYGCGSKRNPLKKGGFFVFLFANQNKIAAPAFFSPTAILYQARFPGATKQKTSQPSRSQLGGEGKHHHPWERSLLQSHSPSRSLASEPFEWIYASELAQRPEIRFQIFTHWLTSLGIGFL